MDHRLGGESSGQTGASDSDFWVAYWHERWKTGPQKAFPKAHLYAYLQEPCYWNARDLSRRFKTVHCGLEDCFQAAMYKSDNVLQGFNPDSKASLATYANRAFGNAIRDALGRYDSLNVCSDLSLLRRTSRKFLKEALEVDGTTSESVKATYEAALLSFQAILPPRSRTIRDLGHLTPENWTAMVREYSKLKARQPAMKLAMGGEAELRGWLHNCVKSLRCYKAPSFVSLNKACLEQEQEEFLDQLTDHEQVVPLERLEFDEAERDRQQLRQQVNSVLSDTVDGLNESDQMLLHLYFCEGLKQTEIAKRLEIDQSKVSRHIAKVRKTLLKDLVLWAREELHISNEAPVLKDMSLFLNDWLTLQFSGERKEHVAA